MATIIQHNYYTGCSGFKSCFGADFEGESISCSGLQSCAEARIKAMGRTAITDKVTCSGKLSCTKIDEFDAAYEAYLELNYTLMIFCCLSNY